MTRQKGITTVEFAIVGSAFFLIMLGAMEISRLLYTLGTLDSITQRTARLAAVCPINDGAVFQRGTYQNTVNGGAALPDLTPANIQLTYFRDDGTTTTSRAEAVLVQARLVNYTIDLAIPFINTTGLTTPDFVHVVTAESLGYNPDDGTVSCFGPAA